MNFNRKEIVFTSLAACLALSAALGVYANEMHMGKTKSRVYLNYVKDTNAIETSNTTETTIVETRETVETVEITEATTCYYDHTTDCTTCVVSETTTDYCCPTVEETEIVYVDNTLNTPETVPYIRGDSRNRRTVLNDYDLIYDYCITHSRGYNGDVYAIVFTILNRMYLSGWSLSVDQVIESLEETHVAGEEVLVDPNLITEAIDAWFYEEPLAIDFGYETEDYIF